MINLYYKKLIVCNCLKCDKKLKKDEVNVYYNQSYFSMRKEYYCKKCFDEKTDKQKESK